jgi:hypothetical protein
MISESLLIFTFSFALTFVILSLMYLTYEQGKEEGYYKAIADMEKNKLKMFKDNDQYIKRKPFGET